ncbi:MAG: S24/S26 family peptidase [Clostridiales bacterium]|nr:S24/S26 family peptidase [Clostridiales bacterium]MBR5057873.1 S24/S26 family peptidase [Clostridiales bacterium]
MTKTIAEFLEENGKLTYTNVGVSMMPLLRQGKDLFTIEKNNGQRYKKGDVVLFARGSSRYVLHRIIKVLPDEYVILGDNCVSCERGIKDSDIHGKMISFVRNGKEHSVTEKRYRVYTALVLFFNPVRVFFKRIWIKFKHLVKKLLRRA